MPPMSGRRIVVAVTFAAVASIPLPAWAAEISVGAGGVSPDRVQADVGETIVWTNDSDDVVTLSGQQPQWSSGPLEPGGTFSLTFDEAGTFTYASEDGSLSGEVVVVGEGPAPAPDDGESGAGGGTLPATGVPVAVGAAAALLGTGAALVATGRRKAARNR
jgi:plastocyanin